MKHFSHVSTVLLLLSFVLCCKKDSGPEPVRELQKQAPKDDEALVSYLQSHFYNYEDFENDPDNHKIKITIDSISDENTDKISLWDQIDSKTIDLNDKMIIKSPIKCIFWLLKRV
jgi:hypothetical protein